MRSRRWVDVCCIRQTFGWWLKVKVQLKEELVGEYDGYVSERFGNRVAFLIADKCYNVDGVW